MKHVAVILAFSCLLSGCSTVQVVPISYDEAINAHSGEPSKNGYIVYEPIVVIELTHQKVCTKKDDKGKCIEKGTRLALGKPFVLPDYSKPYRVEVKHRLGKIEYDNTYADGWLLSKSANTYDESALLAFAGNAVTAVSSLLSPGEGLFGGDQEPDLAAPGLYKVTRTPDGPRLEMLLPYTQ